MDMDDFPPQHTQSVRLRKGEKELTFNIEDMVVSRIAAAFSLQPPIHLIKEFENSVLFPSESSGKFNPSALRSGALYEVQGSELKTNAATPSIPFGNAATPPTPFGVYPYPQTQMHSQYNLPRHKQRQIKKTILLANLSTRDPTKPSSSRANKLVHTVVTQLIISLDSATCNLTQASELVKTQVGFDVILLDSKLFPLMDNNSTIGVDFWRSTRKVIAVSRASYEKLVGVVSGEELSQEADDVINLEPPCKKVKKSDNIITLSDVNKKYDNINKKLDSVTKSLSFVDNIKKMFECIICKSMVRSPIVSSCCQRIVGCRICVTTWRENSARCPLCSVSGRMNSFELKGFDDFTGSLPVETEGAEGNSTTIEVSDSSSSDFEDLPTFITPRSTSS